MALLVLLVCIALAAGQTQQLTSENFNELVSSGSWMLKFYAPWCTHCQKMAGDWQTLADNLKAADIAVEVAEVDCTTSKDVCQAFEVKGYPSLIFVNGDVRIPYRGARTAGEMEHFVRAAIAPPLTVVSADELAKLRVGEQAFLLLVVDDVESQQDWQSTVRTAARHLVIALPCHKTTAAIAGTAPGLYIFKGAGEVSIYGGEADSKDIVAWARKEKLPALSELTRMSAGELSENPDVTLLAILLVEGPIGSTVQKDIVKQVALSPRESWKYRFLWMNGAAAEWRAFVEGRWQLSARDLPRFLVFNMRTGEYYPHSGELSAAAISAFLDAVAAGAVPAQGGRSIPAQIAGYLTWIWDVALGSASSAWAEYPQVMQLSAASIVFFIVITVRNALRQPAPKDRKTD
eukprot:m.24428 g.24428  ORF g.24428 m.24428 type:complete len:404 (-) comp4015_c0_seq1:94-1305(-)